LLEYNKKIQEFKDVMSKQNKKGFELFLEEVKKQPQSNDFDSFFKKWINSNDEIFQDFFKSKEYGELLKNLIKSGAKLRSSLDKYTQQVLKESNIATKHELDRAYKEIYQLKKELKSIKSKLSDLEGNIITLKKEVNK
jgi:seryl-tRNA synthetase